MFKCWVCEEGIPDSLKHEHHKIPKSLGGSDAPENILWLCHTDHNNLHLIAYMILNPKRRHEVEPVLASIFSDHNSRKRLMQLAVLVAREIALKKETKKDKAEEVRSFVELPQRYLELLRLVGYEMPGPTGRPAGVNRVIRNLIADKLLERFPVCKDEINSLRKPKPKQSDT